jgi:hypothetical protein
LYEFFHSRFFPAMVQKYEWKAAGKMPAPRGWA